MYIESQMLGIKIGFRSLPDTRILNQALVYVRDVKKIVPRTDILAKSAMFDDTPAGKSFTPRIFAHWNFLQNLISIIRDSFSWQ